MTALSSALETASTVGRTVLVPLLDDVPMPSEVKPGWVALGLMVTLFVVTALLWMSMRKQLRRIDFEEEPNGDAPEDPDEPTRP